MSNRLKHSTGEHPVQNTTEIQEVSLTLGGELERAWRATYNSTLVEYPNIPAKVASEENGGTNQAVSKQDAVERMLNSRQYDVALDAVQESGDTSVQPTRYVAAERSFNARYNPAATQIGHVGVELSKEAPARTDYVNAQFTREATGAEPIPNTHVDLRAQQPVTEAPRDTYQVSEYASSEAVARAMVESVRNEATQ